MKEPACSACIVCGHPVTAPWLDQCADLYLQTPFIVDYRECPDCHLVQQLPLPSDTALFYPTTYPMHTGRGTLHRIARKLLIHKVYFAPPPAARDQFLLDFGCGDGSYLRSIKNSVSRMAGFEASGQHAGQLQADLGCRIYSYLEEASADLAGSVDIVTAHFVLEHLTEIHEAFHFWGQILKPGGILHITVPNIRSYQAAFFGKKWHALDPPRHISFPEDATLALLMKKHRFELVTRQFGIFPNLWAASMATALAGRYHHLLFLLLLPLGFILALIMPQDTFVYTIRKI